MCVVVEDVHACAIVPSRDAVEVHVLGHFLMHPRKLRAVRLTVVEALPVASFPVRIAG